MTHQTGRSRPAGTPGPRRDRPRIRLAVLGGTAVVLVWTGHDVTWALLGRTGALWLLDRSGVVLGVAMAAAVLRIVTRSWLATAVIGGLIVALLS